MVLSVNDMLVMAWSLIIMIHIHQAFGQHELGPCSPGPDGKTKFEHKVPIQKLEAIVGAPVSCDGNFASSYPCRNIDMESFLPPSSLTGTRLGNEYLNDIWGWTDLNTGVEYAIVGMFGGTSFVNLSDPTSPIVVGYLPTHSMSSDWRDIKTYKNHAFIVSEAKGHGMQVFDLTQLVNFKSFTN